MLKTTALHEVHIELGAKMGEFAGYDMPLYYKDGVIKEHLWVRSNCGLFDVSHMGQVMIKGADDGRDAIDFIQKITPSLFEKLSVDATKYTVLLNEDGGIIDDLMVTRTGQNAFHLVINAGCKDKDIAWMRSQLPDGLDLTYFKDWALLALQGPKAEGVMAEVLGVDVSNLTYMGLMTAKYQGQDIYISRLGYTGEDGFEVAVSNDGAADMAVALMGHDDVKPIGLAARDSLRLEMGYALYGHDIDVATSPVEAGLNWVISKSRSGYIGYARIHKDFSEGVEKKLVGIKLVDRGIAREGAVLFDGQEEKIGQITSGGYSPSLEQSIAMGYVSVDFAHPGAEILVDIRGKKVRAAVVELPFMPAKTKSVKRAA